MHTLSGEVNEVIERNSTQSAVTMKEAGLTLKMSVKYFLTHILNQKHYRMADNVKPEGRKSKTNQQTWCGLPHNLLLPR